MTLLSAFVIFPSIAWATPSGASTSSSTVEVGMPFPEDLSGLPAAIGGGTGPSGATFPSGAQIQAFETAIVGYLNSHGGLLSHKVQPVFYGVKVLAPGGAAADQAQCTAFTQDNHVFAVIPEINSTTNLYTCLNKAHVFIMDAAGTSGVDNSTYKSLPYYATAGTLSLNNTAAVEVNGLVKQGFFNKGAKVGLVAYNTTPYTNAISQTLKPALKKHGLTLSDQVLINPVTGVQDVGAAQTAINAGLLRFKTEGINHVIFLDTEGATVMPFVTAETPQNYYPRLGFTSNELPADRTYSGNPYDKDQLNQFAHALGVGWDPLTDLAHPPALNSTAQKCISIMEGAGASAGQAQIFLGTCDQLLALQAAVNAGGKLTPQAAVAGLAKAKNIPTGELMASPVYVNGQRDGASIGRFLAFQTACQCFQYTGGQLKLSTLEGH